MSADDIYTDALIYTYILHLYGLSDLVLRRRTKILPIDKCPIIEVKLVHVLYIR